MAELSREQAERAARDLELLRAPTRRPSAASRPRRPSAATPESSSCGCTAGRSEPARRSARPFAPATQPPPTSVAATSETGASCCGGAVITDEEAKVFGAGLYDEDDRGELPDTAKMASLGCGNPTAVAELGEGETVLDLGSGGGIDVLLSARRVGPPARPTAST